MKNTAIAAVAAFAGFILATLPPESAFGQQIVELHKAVNLRQVSARAEGLGGYSMVRLEIRNLTEGALLVDTAGSYLVPNGRYQRLGLGTPVVARTSSARRLIPLGPKGTWQGDVNSCCMDEGLSSPAQGIDFSPGAGPSPERVYKALRIWAACPGLTQSEVNSVVWGHTDVRSLEEKANGLGLSFLPDLKKSRLKADGGRIFWLSPEGFLHAKQSGSVDGWDVLDSNVADFEVGWGEVVTYRADLEVMKRYNATERAWEEWTLPRRPRSIVIGPGMSFYSVSEGGDLYLKRQGDECFSAVGLWVKSFAVSHQAVNPYFFAIRGGAEEITWSRGNDGWRIMPFHKMDEIGSTAGALYASEPSGVYRYCGAWKRVAGPQSSFLAGESVCYLRTGSSFRVYGDKANSSKACPKPKGEVVQCAVDRTSDELICIMAGGEVDKLAGDRWIHLGTVPSRPEKASGEDSKGK